MNLERKAREFAIEAHAGQYRADGVTPYITHPEAVVELLRQVPIYDENILAAGWLHDVVEDCQVPRETLRSEFNSEVERIVVALTRNCFREDYKKRIENADYAVQIIKLADLVSNCSDLRNGVPEKTIQNKVNDCKELYFKLAGKTHPPFHRMLMDSMSRYLAPNEISKYEWIWDD